MTQKTNLPTAFALILPFLLALVLFFGSCRNPAAQHEVTVSFDTAGGMPAIESQIIPLGGTVEPVAPPTRAGFRFNGWYSGPDYTYQWDFDNDTVTKELTLYAGWTRAGGGGGGGSGGGGTSGGSGGNTGGGSDGGTGGGDGDTDLPDPPPVDNFFNINVQTAGTGTAGASLGTAAAGTQVTLTASSSSPHEFGKWRVVSGGVTLSCYTRSSATFTMPSADVTIEAIFVDASFYDAGYIWTPFGEIYAIRGLTVWSLPADHADLIIPGSINGKPIEAIGDYVFCGFNTGIRLTSVSIPCSVIYIMGGAFAANSITQLHIPNNVSYIGAAAFDTNDLRSVTIPAGVNTIWDFAFAANRNLNGITFLGDNVTLGNFVFLGSPAANWPGDNFTEPFGPNPPAGTYAWNGASWVMQ